MNQPHSTDNTMIQAHHDWLVWLYSHFFSVETAETMATCGQIFLVPVLCFYAVLYYFIRKGRS